MINRKLILLILDGWGYREDKSHNAIALCNPVNFNKLIAKYPNTLLNASGEFVGLPDGQMGNSEVGHTNIGAGRIVYQDFLKINKAIDEGSLLKNKNFMSFMERVKTGSNRLHFFGLLSDGGVHSHINHLKGLIKIAKSLGIKEIYVHAFMDGRDTPPTSGINYILDLENFLKSMDNAYIATVSGRFYAMDRDNRWDRVEKAYKTIRFGSGVRFKSGEDALKFSYENNITDEFIEPCVLKTNGMVRDGDGIFFFNFRADRAREITRVFTQKNFDEFDRGKVPEVFFMSMTEYDSSFDFPCAFPPESLKNILGEIISNNGLSQLRIAETEKYAHVTFFFNGGREKVFEKEKRILIDSPRDVATYDLKPEMSIYEVTEKFEMEFKKGNIDVVIMNFANPDMVGHTGNEEAAIKACKHVDNCLGKVMKVAEETDSILVVTADHGNCEQMIDENGEPHTAHTLNKVPFIVYNYKCKLKTDNNLKLADIAPTVLNVLNIDKPIEMTGESLIIE
jgi:2,3-bisphosphoglycerate-independent phosphoglycerate mutase